MQKFQYVVSLAIPQKKYFIVIVKHIHLVPYNAWCKTFMAFVNLLQTKLSSKMFCLQTLINSDNTSVLEITVSHWSFFNQFQHLADQNLF